MSPISPRRKRGLLIGVGLLSAAALVAFGTSRARQQRRGTEPAGEGSDEGQPSDETTEPTLWDRTREMAQAAWLLVSQRRPHDS